ncbi:MAG: sialidase family protein [Ginsengibacter sp.]
MISKIIFAFAFLFAISTTDAQNKDLQSGTEKGKIISSSYWVADKVQEIRGLKHGPFVTLPNNNIVTVDGNEIYRSTDEGKSWLPYAEIADTNKFLISPGAMIRTSKNIIILSFVNLKEKANWNWQKDIHDSPGSLLPSYAVRSIDDGKTWEIPQKLHNEWTGANRDMIETRDGSIVLTSMIMRHHPGHHTVLTYTSKDEGKSWIASNIIDLGGVGNHSGVMESTLVQLKDGRLWMLLRTNWGNFWQTFSDNDGLTWKETGPTNIDASSSPGIIKRLKSGNLVLVWNRLFPEGKTEYPLRGGDGNLSEVPANWQRDELSIMFSSDDGKSWSKPVVFAKVTRKGEQLSYPYVFEVKPGKLWITTSFRGDLGINLYEKDFVDR